MKTFTFRYDPSLPSISKELAAVVKSKKKIIFPDELVSKSLKTLLEVATSTRLRIFEAIVSRCPNSLYELAKMLEMSQSLVLKEARFLEALGLIDLRTERVGARARLRAVARYSRVVIDCGFIARAS